MTKNLTLTTSTLEEAALGIADVVAKLSHGLHSEATTAANATMGLISALIPPRAVSEMAEGARSQLVGMYCTTSSPWQGIIIAFEPFPDLSVKVLELGPSPEVLNVPLNDVRVCFSPAFPSTGLPSQVHAPAPAPFDVEEPFRTSNQKFDATPSFSSPVEPSGVAKAAAEAQKKAREARKPGGWIRKPAEEAPHEPKPESVAPKPKPKPKPAAPEPAAPEDAKPKDTGYPIDFDEFQKLPNKSVVRVGEDGQEQMWARRTRKNRWLVDGSGGTSNDTDTWECLTDIGTVHCVRNGIH
ncbi:MAG: hypothetical protein L0L01_04240 [Bifidobacterium crudilactis]|nr:hypothetical protein [Bifidobacterium crudilactis]